MVEPFELAVAVESVLGQTDVSQTVKVGEQSRGQCGQVVVVQCSVRQIIQINVCIYINDRQVCYFSHSNSEPNVTIHLQYFQVFESFDGLFVNAQEMVAVH